MAAVCLTAQYAGAGEEETIKRGEVPSKVAFLVANEQYVEPETLHTPCNDVNDLAPLLRDNCNFDVRPTLVNRPSGDLEREVKIISNSHGTVDIVLFYYSGHGYQSGGQNYLRSTKDNDDISLESVLHVLNRLHPRLVILLLDCCRAPEAESGEGLKGGRVKREGLARFIAPPQAVESGASSISQAVIVSYAAAINKSALDRDLMDRTHSPYAKVLTELLKTPRLDVGDLLRLIEIRVKARTKGRQDPWVDFRGPEALRQVVLVWDASEPPAPGQPPVLIPAAPSETLMKLDELDEKYRKDLEK